MTSEREFIRQLHRRFAVRPPVRVGIGDDGAVLTGDGRDQVVVTDMLLDGVHFDLQDTAPELVGRKAVAVNLSDLAAMACWPTAAFLSIAVSPAIRQQERFLPRLYDGIAELADRYRFTVAGGDTNAWQGPFVINVCLTGFPVTSRPILRSGAKPGDQLCVTGPLGGSLRRGRHLSFEPRLETARWLVENTNVHAMMDISDGLSLDLHRLTEASGCGATIDADLIPQHSDIGSSEGSAALQSALSDGEDFELLLALSESSLKEARQRPDCPRLWQIGRIDANVGCRLRSGTDVTDLLPLGWQHL
ncbi:MAG: thiamine-phosphate kinase [Fuerstiella sp.]